jgi:hypothetical protein
MVGIDSVDTKNSKNDSEQLCCSPLKEGPIALCARHDVVIGSYLLELDPAPEGMLPELLVYTRLSQLSDGEVLYQGALRFVGGPTWTAECYGGSPYPIETLDEQVQSD